MKRVGRLFPSCMRLAFSEKASRPFLRAIQRCTKVLVEVSPRGPDHFPARDDNYIHTYQWFAASKQLADDSLGSIPSNSIADLLAGRDPEPRGSVFVRENEPGHEPASQPRPLLIHLLEFRPAAKLFLTQSRGPPAFARCASARLAEACVLNSAGKRRRHPATCP